MGRCLMVTEIVVTVLLAVLCELALHWFPWRMVFVNGLPRVLAYTSGMLGIVLPFSGLLVLWGELLVLAVLWLVVVSCGVAVTGAYGLDWLLDWQRTNAENKEREYAAKRLDK